MDRYQRVEKPRPESAIDENEIRITSQGLIRNYVSYATSLLELHVSCVQKRIPGLYQDTVISSVSITDVWEPIEEGLVPLSPRHVCQSISKDINNHSSINSNHNFNQDKRKANFTKIHMYEDVVEAELEEEEGDGEEDMVDMLAMTIIRVDMATIKVDMVTMAIIKVDTVDMSTIKVL
ncbi:hypothetical protein GW17_00025175 [Ensete ventricosum]|nr:hypothetical protein GW17_00025175 [Ensete ventricosum]RZS18883.1 hypothetical protein BHM03_00051213 [Ensete ventricosum]